MEEKVLWIVEEIPIYVVCTDMTKRTVKLILEKFWVDTVP
jgi:hypothetical protein